jgi:hypothetical protein
MLNLKGWHQNLAKKFHQILPLGSKYEPVWSMLLGVHQVSRNTILIDS